ncbi:MAG: adenylyltransferase/cytidyltransferase family protein, partial [Candidatus Diapherotrites archaeon]|nr:adenylyltransferase/cytidyltransferase family protein [Candidatus Diapherotrites archaeon]
TFDLLHTGHLRLFKKCRQLAGEKGVVIVGLNTDEFVFKFKKKYPLLTYKEREELIKETGLVDIIIKNNQKDGTIKDVIKKTKPQIIVVGSDWARKDYLSQIGLNWDYLDKNKIWLCYVNYEWGISSSELKKRLLK